MFYDFTLPMEADMDFTEHLKPVQNIYLVQLQVKLFVKSLKKLFQMRPYR
jgi:hypothetical protein